MMTIRVALTAVAAHEAWNGMRVVGDRAIPKLAIPPWRRGDACRRGWRRGLAMTDLAVGVAVIAVLMGGVLGGAASVETSRTTRTIDDVQRLRRAVRTWVDLGNVTYTSLSIPALQTANVLSTATVLSAWGTPVALVARTPSTYWITLEGLPAGARAGLIRQFQDQAVEIAGDETQLRLGFQ